ncbi:MAG: hypothetical protein DMENIID0002_06480 [Rickettsia endosymbiont of Sergentomyia squamirostris]|uniref:Uncharacterized protein n=1 Tax=Candidatus Tisiphia endosymbiont of Sergentomyia squamirostris TaxID=3113639 RepID=A0AAT9G886_9RICK
MRIGLTKFNDLFFRNLHSFLDRAKEFANSLINYLESLLLQEHYKAFDNISINGNLKDIQNLFEDDEINELINFTKQQLSDKPN